MERTTQPMQADNSNGIHERPIVSGTLLRHLCSELLYAEHTVAQACRREAPRLEAHEARRVLLDVAEHADASAKSLPELLARHGLPLGRRGMLFGALRTVPRERWLDHHLEAERSCSGVVLPLSESVDLVKLVREVSLSHHSYGELRAFCDVWLDIRTPLVGQAEQELSWFAEQGESALGWSFPLPGLKHVKRGLVRA